MLTRAQIHRFLRESGISCHDTVPVHTSMRALGNAEVGIFDAKRGMAVLKTLRERASYDLCKEPREIPLSYYADITV